MPGWHRRRRAEEWRAWQSPCFGLTARFTPPSSKFHSLRGMPAARCSGNSLSLLPAVRHRVFLLEVPEELIDVSGDKPPRGLKIVAPRGAITPALPRFVGRKPHAGV